MSFLRARLFAGRAAIVSGGGTGIGYAISSELMALGCDVLIASRNEGRLRAAVDKLNSTAASAAASADVRQPQATMFACDIRDEDSVAALVATATER